MTNNNDEWDEVDVPSGSFAKFATIGDSVAGTVVSYDPDRGGKNFDGDECGVLVLEDADGDHVIVTLDKGRLKDVVKNGEPVEGKPLRITYVSDLESKAGRSYKNFGIAVGKHWKPKPAPTSLDF